MINKPKITQEQLDYLSIYFELYSRASYFSDTRQIEDATGNSRSHIERCDNIRGCIHDVHR